jgi:hypothetical protein
MVVTVVLIIYVLIQEQQPTDSRKMTFAECEAIGGEPWRVDHFHPDICPACAEYAECQAAYDADDRAGNLAEACPQGKACAACMQRTDFYPDTCPGGRTKVGEITDAAIWFQCCK